MENMYAEAAVKRANTPKAIILRALICTWGSGSLSDNMVLAAF